MTRETQLYYVLCQLFEFATDRQPDSLFEAVLTKVLEHNNFENEYQTPAWLLNFLKAIVSKRPVPATNYHAKQSGSGDTFNLLAELEDIIPAEWVNEGEILTVTFHAGLVIGFISFADTEYEIRVYKDI